MGYLDTFLEKLEKDWKGSLVSVSDAKQVEKNAKKFLSLLAQQDRLARVSWGWYWVPDKYQDFYDFLTKDKHLKVLQKQTAASFWNGDFIHRDYYIVAVQNESYGKALQKLSEGQGWNTRIETRNLTDMNYEEIDGIYVESIEDTIIDCLKEWAFTDAFATLHENYEALDWDKVSKHYWERIPRTNLRVGQVIKYGTNIITRGTQHSQYSSRARMPEGFMKRQVEEAAEKVIEFA